MKSEESSFIPWTRCFIDCWKTITATFTISLTALFIIIALKLGCSFAAEFEPSLKKFRFRNILIVYILLVILNSQIRIYLILIVLNERSKLILG
jgi:hypothetical protein